MSKANRNRRGSTNQSVVQSGTDPDVRTIASVQSDKSSALAKKIADVLCERFDVGAVGYTYDQMYFAEARNELVAEVIEVVLKHAATTQRRSRKRDIDRAD